MTLSTAGPCIPATNLSRFLRIVLLLVVSVSPVAAQIASSVSLSPSELEIDKIIFQGDTAIESGTLKDLLSLKETPNGFSKFLFHIFGEKLGSGPEYFDLIKFENDQERLKTYYREQGFYRTAVKGEYAVDTLRRRLNVSFLIDEGKRSYIDSIIYAGLVGLPHDVAMQIFSEPLIYKGKPYESEKATAEVRRILVILGNNGYANAKFDAEHSAAYHHAYTSNNFDLRLQFILGVQQHFGDISIRTVPQRDDITDDIVLRQLDFHTGDVYSREKKNTSARSLNRLGLFETATVDTTAVGDSTVAVPIVVNLRPRPRNELTPEIGISDENYAFNLGVGLGYTNRNFFGDARSFTASARLRTQSIQYGAADLQFAILQPYLFTRTLSGSWTTTISVEKQPLYTLSILRNKVGLANQFATYTYGFLDWTLERVNPEINPDILQDTTRAQGVFSILQQQASQPQFNSIITATLQRDKTNDIFSPTDGFFNSISVEESGILPKIFPHLVGSLPFTQYYKVTLFERWYHDLTSSKFNILAIKLKTGYQDKYGESRSLPVTIPLNRRFFAGGSGSIRGWRARELGAMPDELLQFGGNFLFEGSAELRVNHFRGFGKAGFVKLENIWAVYFFDFGNVWSDITDVKAKDVAMAAGLGLRYETFFGPFRIDYGFKVYDPKDVPGHKSIFQKRLLGETLNSGVFSFGIGHAF